jgi:hypothetical protein
MGKIHALDGFQKAVDEMLARLLAIADDIDPAVLLELERQDGGIALGGVERGAFEPPRRPKPVRLGKPSGR